MHLWLNKSAKHQNKSIFIVEFTELAGIRDFNQLINSNGLLK